VNDTEENLRHEVQELRAEVSRLRNILNCLGLAALAIIVLAAPTAVAVLAAMVVFALLASPVRDMIFPTVFSTPKKLPRWRRR